MPPGPVTLSNLDPLKTFFGGAAKGIAEVRRLFDGTRDWKP